MPSLPFSIVSLPIGRGIYAPNPNSVVWRFEVWGLVTSQPHATNIVSALANPFRAFFIEQTHPIRSISKMSYCVG
jgi:hypothetical protein